MAIKTVRVAKITIQTLEKFKAEIVSDASRVSKLWRLDDPRCRVHLQSQIIMTPLHHPNLVKLYGGCWNEGPDKLCIVLEFCAQGSLRTLLDGTTRVGTWKDPRYGLAHGVAMCFKYLHHGLNEPLIHRDLKPDNVLVSEVMQSKVADFGESKLFEKRNNEFGVLTMTMVGTALYCPPEASRLLNGNSNPDGKPRLTAFAFLSFDTQILLQVAYNERVDVFSFGFTLLEVVLGDCKYIKDHFMGSWCVVSRTNGGMGWRPPIPSTLAKSQPDLVKLIHDCVLDDMNARPTFVDITARLEDCESSTNLLEEEALLSQVRNSKSNAFYKEHNTSLYHPQVSE